jgi:hypothetical protein
MLPQSFIPHGSKVYNFRILLNKLKTIYRLNRRRLIRLRAELWNRVRGISIPLWPEPDFPDSRRKIWHKQPLSIFLLYAFVPALWFWGRSYPSIPPGYAVTALGGAAALMSLLGEMKGIEKVAWICILFGFVNLELYAIRDDRVAQDQLQNAIRNEQILHFQTIGKDIQKSIEISDREFAATTEKSNRVIGLQTAAVAGLATNLNTLTGAESFCYLGFAPGQSYLTFVHVGKFPLYGVSARIVEEDQNGQIRRDNLLGVTVPVGDMIKGHANLQTLPSGLGSSPDYFNANIFFTARNGDWMQLLRERSVNGKLVLAMRVVGRFTSLQKEKSLCETIDPNFPRKSNGDIDSDFHLSMSELPRCQ